MIPPNTDPRHSAAALQSRPRIPSTAAVIEPRRPTQAASTTDRVVRYAMLVATLALVGLLVSLAVGASLGDSFSSTSQVLVRPPLSAQTIVTGNPGAEEDIQRVVDTDLQVAQSRDFLSRVAAQFNHGAVSADTLAHNLTIATTGDADLIAFTATEADARSAQAVATVAANQFVTYVKGLSTSAVGSASAASQDPLVKDAVTRLQLLQQLAPTALIASPASSSIQLRPNHSRDGLIGLTGGLVVAVCTIALSETVLNRRRGVDEMPDAA